MAIGIAQTFGRLMVHAVNVEKMPMTWYLDNRSQFKAHFETLRPILLPENHHWDWTRHYKNHFIRWTKNGEKKNKNWNIWNFKPWRLSTKGEPWELLLTKNYYFSNDCERHIQLENEGQWITLATCCWFLNAINYSVREKIWIQARKKCKQMKCEQRT